MARVEGARLDSPGRVSRVLPGRRGPVEWTLTGRVVAFDVDVAASLRPGAARIGRRRCASAWPTHVGVMTGLQVRSVDVTVTGLDRQREPAR